MTDPLLKPIDLELWLNAELIQQQNLLKSQFIAVFEKVGNAFSIEDFYRISTKSRGIKLSKGNDLLGFPYQVLDFIRDFDSNNGVNIRLLNWFGNGLYFAVYLGKNRRNPFFEFLEMGFSFGLSENQWDYGDLILNKNLTVEKSEINGKDFEFYHWIKELKVDNEPDMLQQNLSLEMKKIFGILANT